MKELTDEKKQLEQQIQELKNKCEAIEKREAEKRSMEERKHAEEIAFLKKTNLQLKVINNFLLNQVLILVDAIGRDPQSSKEIDAYPPLFSLLFQLIHPCYGVLSTCLFHCPLSGLISRTHLGKKAEMQSSKSAHK